MPADPITLPNVTFDNTAPGTIAPGGVTFDNAAPGTIAPGGVTFNNTAPILRPINGGFLEVVAASTGPVNLATFTTSSAMDGVVPGIGNPFLVKDQADPVQNGVYVILSVTPERIAQYDDDSEMEAGLFVFVKGGTINATTSWQLTGVAPLIVGVDELHFYAPPHPPPLPFRNDAPGAITLSGVSFNNGAPGSIAPGGVIFDDTPPEQISVLPAGGGLALPGGAELLLPGGGGLELPG